MSEQKPLVQNAGDEEQVKKAAKKERWSREQQLEDLRHVLSNKQGRRFVWRYLCACGIFEQSFQHAAKDSVTAFNEGKRNIGLSLLADVSDGAPDAYLLMLNESKQGD